MTRLIAGNCLLLAGVAGWAETPSYSYIQASYVDIDFDSNIADDLTRYGAGIRLFFDR